MSEADDHKWYMEHDLIEYSGKWVAIRDEKVIAAEEDFKKLVKEVTKRFKLSEVFLARIPEKGVALVYVGF